MTNDPNYQEELNLNEQKEKNMRLYNLNLTDEEVEGKAKFYFVIGATSLTFGGFTLIGMIIGLYFLFKAIKLRPKYGITLFLFALLFLFTLGTAFFNAL